MDRELRLLILFIAAVSCTSIEIVKEKTDEDLIIKPAIDRSDGHNILPVYEIKSLPSTYTQKICSPFCYKEIYEKPVYLLTRSDKPKEYDIVYIKEGLKGYKPKDKVKFFNVIGKAVSIVFDKYDFPKEKYPYTELDVKDPEIPKDVPYVLITNEEGLAEVNRDDKYGKVAEIEVSSDGLITRVVELVKHSVLEYKVVDKSNGRKIETIEKEEKLRLQEPELRFSPNDILKSPWSPSSSMNFEHINYRPFYPQNSFNDFLKYYSSRPHSYNDFAYPSKFDQSFFEQNYFSPQRPQYSEPSKYWGSPLGYESMNMNYYSGSKHRYPSQDYEYFNMNQGNYPNYGYSSPGQSYNFNHLSSEPRFPQFGSSGYNSNFQGFNGYNSPGEYESYYQNPNYMYNGESLPGRDKFAYLNAQQYPSYFPRPEMKNKYFQNKFTYNPFYQSQSSKYPFNYGSGEEDYSSGKVSYPSQYYQFHQSNSPCFPPKFGFPYYKPGPTYVFNMCESQKPHYFPEVEAASVDHKFTSTYLPTKPEQPVQMTHPTEHSPKTVPSLRSQSITNFDEFDQSYEPNYSFRKFLYRPVVDESDEFRKLIGHPKPTGEKSKHPIQFLYSQPQFAPPTNNLNRPPPNSLPSGFVAASQP